MDLFLVLTAGWIVQKINPDFFMICISGCGT